MQLPTIPPSVENELMTLAKGMLAAIAAGAVMGFMQYAGTHIVPAMQALVMWLSAYGGIKAGAVNAATST